MISTIRKLMHFGHRPFNFDDGRSYLTLLTENFKMHARLVLLAGYAGQKASIFAFVLLAYRLDN